MRVARGIENVVVDPASIRVDRRARSRKTDRLDLDKLVAGLIRHARGEPDEWRVVRVPTAECEDHRRLHRERERLVKERTAHSNRIRSLLVTQGIRLNVTRNLEKQLEHVRLWDDSHEE